MNDDPLPMIKSQYEFSRLLFGYWLLTIGYFQRKQPYGKISEV